MLLPADIRAALEREFAVPRLALGLASQNEPFNAGCVIEPGLPRYRLLLAAVSPRFAIVHFEAGGYAISQNVLVFRRGVRGDTAEKIASSLAFTAWEEPKSFLSATRSGELLVDRSKTPAQPYPLANTM
jgi:hypothetical protein